MNTIHHGFWTYFIFRKKKKLVKYFIVGSVSPDLIYYIMFIYLGVIQNVLNESFFSSFFHMFFSKSNEGFSLFLFKPLTDLVHVMFDHPVVILLRMAGHSIVIWGIIFSLSVWRNGIQLNRINSFMWGWLGHILIDLLTHVTDAVPIFYPISNVIIRGPISYWHPQYFGREFSVVHIFIMVAAIVFLIIEKVKKLRKYR